MEDLDSIGRGRNSVRAVYYKANTAETGLWSEYSTLWVVKNRVLRFPLLKI